MNFDQVARQLYYRPDVTSLKKKTLLTVRRSFLSGICTDMSLPLTDGRSCGVRGAGGVYCAMEEQLMLLHVGYAFALCHLKERQTKS